ncbi:MAG: hypothetical protein K1X94_03925 [Sandaracinaceae bacterium]|nr:hypothetical protein [Sandaracinaceae bacterium]
MSFRDDRDAMRARIEELETELEAARARVAELESASGEVNALRARVAELEAELAKHTESPKARAKREKREREQREAAAKREAKESAARSEAASSDEERSLSWREILTLPRVVGGLVIAAFVGVLAYAFLVPPTWTDAHTAPSLGLIDLDATPSPPPVNGLAEGGHLAPMGCAGIVPAAPQLVLRSASRRIVTLDVESSVDTVMLVLASDGTVSCDDDSGGGSNPSIRTVVPAGETRVWVGLYDSETGTSSFTLRIGTEAPPDGEIDARGLSPSSTPALGRLALADGVLARSGSFVATVSASVADDSCRGQISMAPSLALAIDAPSYVRLDASSDTDLVLVVQHPDGSISCDDDGGPGTAPRVATRFEVGTHLVWVGRYSASDQPTAFSLEVRGVVVGAGAATPPRSFGAGDVIEVQGGEGFVQEAHCNVLVPAVPDAELELASRLDVELVSDTSSGTVLVDVGPWGPLCLSQGRASWPAGRHQLFVVADEEVTSPRRVQLRAAPPSLTPYP